MIEIITPFKIFTTSKKQLINNLNQNIFGTNQKFQLIKIVSKPRSK